jgi:lysosomal alpha-mannosidase
MLFGDDFRYMNAFQNYENMDAMISYINEHHGDKYNLFYSTPSMYVDAVASYNVSWPSKYDDLFPYSDNSNSYWTGYFTSRPNDKGYIRRASSNYHASN